MKRPVVLVVDDSAFVRSILETLLNKIDIVDRVIVAENGEDGIKKVFKYKPDIIILDLDMPKMDGFTFLRMLMNKKSLPVIILSSQDDHTNVLKAMEAGAIDFISKPQSGSQANMEEIIPELKKKIEMTFEFRADSAKIVNSENLKIRKVENYDSVFLPPEKLFKGEGDTEKNIIVAIGSSTGGPAALYQIFKTLEVRRQMAILVSQHMPGSFTTAFAERLDKISAYMIKIGEHGERVRGGFAYISPGDKNMTLKKVGESYYLEINEKSPEDHYVPSINKLFYSVAHSVGKSSIGVILTGMGNDGAEGLLEIKNKNGYTIAESEESAIVYGMPREAYRIGAVDRKIPLRDISNAIERKADILIKRNK